MNTPAHKNLEIKIGGHFECSLIKTTCKVYPSPTHRAVDGSLLKSVSVRSPFTALLQGMTKTREIQRAELSQTFNLNIFENKKDWTISLTLSYSSNFDFSHQLLKAFQNRTFSRVFHRKNPRLWN